VPRDTQLAVVIRQSHYGGAGGQYLIIEKLKICVRALMQTTIPSSQQKGINRDSD
jgi:hypothetical protein